MQTANQPSSPLACREAKCYALSPALIPTKESERCQKCFFEIPPFENWTRARLASVETMSTCCVGPEFDNAYNLGSRRSAGRHKAARHAAPGGGGGGGARPALLPPGLSGRRGYRRTNDHHK